MASQYQHPTEGDQVVVAQVGAIELRHSPGKRESFYAFDSKADENCYIYADGTALTHCGGGWYETVEDGLKAIAKYIKKNRVTISPIGF